MSGRRQTTTPVVSRNYELVSDVCARAVELLLRKPLARKEGGPDEQLADSKEVSHVKNQPINCQELSIND